MNDMATADSFGLFWNSDNGDRKYNDDSLERWLKKFFTSGVFEGDLQVLASSGMTVSIQPGYCNLFGKVGLFEVANSITLDAASSIYPRIDTIVVERTDADRVISLKKITGVYSGDSPQPTAPIWSVSDGVYQLVLAQIYVGAGASAITQANITDTRALSSICGYITGTVEEVDFSQFAAQFTAYFNEFKSGNQADFEEWMDAQETDFMAWYDRMKDQLSEDAAGHLQQEIDGKEDLPTILTATLTAGQTSLAFTDSHITNDCLIDVYTNVANVNPRNWAQSGTTITFTFKAQAVNVDVTLKIREG
jgi:hypothetical protein